MELVHESEVEKGGRVSKWLIVPKVRTSSKTIELGVATLKPGQVEVLHKHVKTEEAFYVISGTPTFQVDDEVKQLKEGTALYVPPNTPHRIANHSDKECKIIVVKTPSNPEDKIILSDKS